MLDNIRARLRRTPTAPIPTYTKAELDEIGAAYHAGRQQLAMLRNLTVDEIDAAYRTAYGC